MEHLTRLIPETNGIEIKMLFDEYEEGKTREAVYVKDIDKYELLVQTLEYEKSEGVKLNGFWRVQKGIQTAQFQKLAGEVVQQRKKLWEERGQNLDITDFS